MVEVEGKSFLEDAQTSRPKRDPREKHGQVLRREGYRVQDLYGDWAGGAAWPALPGERLSLLKVLGSSGEKSGHDTSVSFFNHVVNWPSKRINLT